jgi:hypothetical protein
MKTHPHTYQRIAREWREGEEGKEKEQGKGEEEQPELTQKGLFFFLLRHQTEW